MVTDSSLHFVTLRMTMILNIMNGFENLLVKVKIHLFFLPQKTAKILRKEPHEVQIRKNRNS